MFRKINDKVISPKTWNPHPFLKKHMKTLGLKNIITEIKNSTDSLNSRLDITNEKIPDLERQISRKYTD